MKCSFRPITWCSTLLWSTSGGAAGLQRKGGQQNGSSGLPHIITSNVEHDSPLPEICQRIKRLNRQRERLQILLHTDAAQAVGKIPVHACELGVDYLTIVGHKFYAPRIGALYVNGPGTRTPVYPMLFGGGQERNFRPGTENTPMIAGLGKAADMVTCHLSDYQSHMLTTKLYLEERLKAIFKDKIHFNSNFPGSDVLPNTCNVSILGPTLQERAANALRLSVGRGTTKSDVDAVVEDLRETVQLLENML
ncbi:hypothetical protein F7725_028296 [Dissostichus mawsoni]|uniref:Selenocysteine lyase n=1 Tax=Dissostichus mawsoni TaxID=36200 RepID=A0A7J5XHQ0_DISMA|nr:hypothetical protein F7725_028296 [Dissostichus mawsoni]